MKAIVFVLRGCQAAWLGAYGNEWIGTPNLDRLAAEGIVFDRHLSDCPEPVAAGRAWLGMLGEGSERLLTTLHAGGVRTVLVRANHPDTDAPDWFYARWGEVFDARPQEEDKFPLDQLIRSLPALLDRLANVTDYLLWIDVDRLIPPWDVRQEVFEAYLDQDDGEDEEGDEEEPSEPEEESEADEEELESEPDEDRDAVGEEGPVELIEEEPEEEESVEPIEPVEPVTPWFDPSTGPFDQSDADAREWLHCSHAAVVTSLDAELELVFDELRARGLDRTAAWLLTSDYGYPLGEHGQIGPHRPWLHEELVHLPLILRLPEAAEACRRVDAFTQPPDLAPTLLALFGVPLPAEGLDGVSLLPLARGEVESIRSHAITRLELGLAAELAIRTEEWAYLLPVRVPEGETRVPQLFGKPDDRCEVSDVRSQNLEWVEELEALLRPVEGNEQNVRRP